MEDFHEGHLDLVADPAFFNDREITIQDLARAQAIINRAMLATKTALQTKQKQSFCCECTKECNHSVKEGCAYCSRHMGAVQKYSSILDELADQLDDE